MKIFVEVFNGEGQVIHSYIKNSSLEQMRPHTMLLEPHFNKLVCILDGGSHTYTNVTYRTDESLGDYEWSLVEGMTGVHFTVGELFACMNVTKIKVSSFDTVSAEKGYNV